MPDWSTQNLWWLRPQQDLGGSSAGARGFADGLDLHIRNEAQKNHTIQTMLNAKAMMLKIDQERASMQDASAFQDYLVRFSKDPGTPLPGFQTSEWNQNAVRFQQQYYQNKLHERLLRDDVEINKAISQLDDPGERMRLIEMRDKVTSQGGSMAEVYATASNLFKVQEERKHQREVDLREIPLASRETPEERAVREQNNILLRQQMMETPEERAAREQRNIELRNTGRSGWSLSKADEIRYRNQLEALDQEAELLQKRLTKLQTTGFMDTTEADKQKRQSDIADAQSKLSQISAKKDQLHLEFSKGQDTKAQVPPKRFRWDPQQGKLVPTE